MKKLFLFFILLTLALSVAACGSADIDTTAPTVDTTVTNGSDRLYPDELSSDGVLAYEKSETALSVTVTLPSSADKSLSLLVLTDPVKRFTWQEDADKYLINLAEIALDKDGVGRLTIPYDETKPVYLLLTSSEGCYLKEVK